MIFYLCIIFIRANWIMQPCSGESPVLGYWTEASECDCPAAWGLGQQGISGLGSLSLKAPSSHCAWSGFSVVWRQTLKCSLCRGCRLVHQCASIAIWWQREHGTVECPLVGIKRTQLPISLQGAPENDDQDQSCFLSLTLKALSFAWPGKKKSLLPV